VQVVRELYGVMAARGATAGFVVTSGTFSDDAREFAQGRNIYLVDGRKLFGLIQQARSSLRSRAAPVPPRQPQLLGVRPERQPDMQTSVPDCPKCSAPMVRRTARKGANAGAQFWGCSNFPRCHGTR
jgi:restriction system protein